MLPKEIFECTQQICSPWPSRNCSIKLTDDCGHSRKIKLDPIDGHYMVTYPEQYNSDKLIAIYDHRRGFVKQLDFLSVIEPRSKIEPVNFLTICTVLVGIWLHNNKHEQFLT